MELFIGAVLLTALVFWIGLAALTAAIAKKGGQNGSLWFIVGLFVPFPFNLIAASIFPRLQAVMPTVSMTQLPLRDDGSLKQVVCTACNGSEKGSTCATCYGRGNVSRWKAIIGQGNQFVTELCTACSGSGRAKCTLCSGQGHIWSQT